MEWDWAMFNSLIRQFIVVYVKQHKRMPTITSVYIYVCVCIYIYYNDNTSGQIQFAPREAYSRHRIHRNIENILDINKQNSPISFEAAEIHAELVVFDAWYKYINKNRTKKLYDCLWFRTHCRHRLYSPSICTDLCEVSAFYGWRHRNSYTFVSYNVTKMEAWLSHTALYGPHHPMWSFAAEIKDIITSYFTV